MACPGQEPLGRGESASVYAVALLSGMGYGKKERGEEHPLNLECLGPCALVIA